MLAHIYTDTFLLAMVLGRLQLADAANTRHFHSIVVMQIRAFVKNKEGMAQQELNQSPLPFVESASQPGTPLTHALAPAQVHRCVLTPMYGTSVRRGRKQTGQEACRY